MPELPEVETVARTLAPYLTGRRIVSAEFTKLRVLRGDPEEMAKQLTGQKVTGVRRYGKFILIELHSHGYFIVHLGMTGKLLFDAESAKHTHAILTLDRGVLLYNDSRQFGRLEWSAELPARVAKLGPEPLLVEFDDFAKLLKARNTRMKSLLLNQTFLRGLGNIYADEALFRAGIHPLAVASKLKKDRARKLYDAIRAVLEEAIASKGSSVSDYVDAAERRAASNCSIACIGGPVSRV